MNDVSVGTERVNLEMMANVDNFCYIIQVQTQHDSRFLAVIQSGSK